MGNTLKGIIKLSQSRYEELLKNKTIIVDGVTINYDPLVLYDVEVPKVTTNTSQSITGEKDFTGGIKKNGVDIATINDVPAIVDSLDKAISTSALSANQGKVLNDKISNIVATLNGTSSSFTFDTLSSVISAFGLSIDVTTPSDSYVVGKNTIIYNNGTKTLKNGDVFYIIDTNVPDYWFSLDDMKLYKMETMKVDLSSYVKNETLDLYFPLTGNKTITGNINLGDNVGITGSSNYLKYNNANLAFYSELPKFANSSTPGLVKTQSSYGINLNSSDGTLSIAAATEAEILAKTNTYKPIVPANLEKAVTTIGDSRYGRISVVDDVIVIE